jgi:pyruvate dehydrogenase E2 component (dihydrolipoamide acetyltransferase)
MSPRARRFADQHNFRPPEVQGSGPGGRILESDLRQLYQPPQPRAPGIRDRIARRMRESLATNAQYTLHASAEATGLLALRGRFKTSAAHSGITINDLVTLCVVDALLDVPSLNAEYIDGKIHQHADIHIGFACDTPRGLLVPVVRNAHTLAIDELAAQTKALAGQAVAGTISPDDLSGATFTISNLGGLGIENFTPLLNPPQVAILGVGALQLKPVRRQGEIAFIDAIGLSLTCDHQVIDGAPGARFLAVVKQKIETVELLCAL